MLSLKNVTPILKNFRNFRKFVVCKSNDFIMKKQQVLKIVKNAVLKVDSKAEIILFGSRARGDYNDDSDWDLLILLDKKENEEIKDKIRKNLFYSELETDEIFGTVIHNKSDWEKFEVTPFYQFIKKEGIKI